MRATEDVEKMFGVTSEQLDGWEQDAAAGNLPGVAVGEIVVGRPLMFGETLRPIGFKETESRIAAIDKRASSLGQSRSDYLRFLIEKDLATV